MTSRITRIASLKRYISLLREEEKRLNWLISSTVSLTAGRTDAEINARAVMEKLRNAEMQLGKLRGM
jgi:hypothetical protein